MDSDSAIEDRYKFNLPSLYKEMRAIGCFDRHHENYLQFTDLEWFSADQILAWVYDKHLIDGLIPCAHTLSGHLWAWYPNIDYDHSEAMVFCPDEDEVGVLYAPDFQSTIYHMMLDELANTFLVERSNAKEAEQTLHHFVDVIAAFMPEQWNERLQELVERPLQPTQENFYGVISEDELEQILADDINYARLDEEFCCVKEE